MASASDIAAEVIRQLQGDPGKGVREAISTQVGWALKNNIRERGVDNGSGERGRTLFERMAAIPGETADIIFDTKIPRLGKGQVGLTTLRSMIAFRDSNDEGIVKETPGAVIDQQTLVEAVRLAISEATAPTLKAIADAVVDEQAERLRGE